MILSSNIHCAPSCSDAEYVQQQIGQLSQLPLLLQNLKDLSKIFQNETTTNETIEKLIKYDQCLAINALRIANSAIYGQRGKVLTLGGAVSTIGKEKIRSIYLNSLLDTYFSATGNIEACVREILWKRSYITARIAAAIARTRKWINEDHAYALGLVHNVGTTAISFLLARYCNNLAKPSELDAISFSRKGVHNGLWHSEVGKRLAIKWALPEVFETTIALHLHPEKATKFRPEVKLIWLAGILANSSGHDKLIENDQIVSHCRDLYITEEEWENYFSHVKEIQKEANQIWNIFG